MECHNFTSFFLHFDVILLFCTRWTHSSAIALDFQYQIRNACSEFCIYFTQWNEFYVKCDVNPYIIRIVYGILHFSPELCDDYCSSIYDNKWRERESLLMNYHRICCIVCIVLWCQCLAFDYTIYTHTHPLNSFSLFQCIHWIDFALCFYVTHTHTTYSYWHHSHITQWQRCY